jgi:hypothetical protein
MSGQVASPERVAEALRRIRGRDGPYAQHGDHAFDGGCPVCAGDPVRIADALLAAGVFRDEVTVKAEALEEAAANMGKAGGTKPIESYVGDWLRTRAAAVRAGDPS